MGNPPLPMSYYTITHTQLTINTGIQLGSKAGFTRNNKFKQFIVTIELFRFIVMYKYDIVAIYWNWNWIG